MKYSIALLVLAVVAACECSVISINSGNLNVGASGDGDRLLHSERVSVVSNFWQTRTVNWRGHYQDVITAVIATENSGNPAATAFVVSGGVGRSNAVIRLQAPTGGFDYTIQIWGR